jgi:hypothetical protein
VRRVIPRSGRRPARLATALVAAASVAACTGDSSPPAPAGPTPPVSTLSWSSCPLPNQPGALVRAVAPASGGQPWIAVGQEGGVGGAEVTPAVWTAADGCAWRRAAVRPVTPDGERTGFSAVVRHGRTTVALGLSYSKVHGNIRPTLWRADGGAPLREVELLRELFGGESGISVVGLADTPAAVLAVGAYLQPSAYVGVQVWRTGDGADWTRLPPGADQVSTRTEQLLPRGLAAGATGSVLVGTAFEIANGAREGFEGAAWVAGTGERQWRRASLRGTALVGEGDQRLLTVAPLGSGYAAVAAVRSGAGFGLRSVTSADGLSWSDGGELALPTPLPGGGPPAATMTRAPAGPAGAEAPPAGVVAGAVAGGEPLVWRSADGRDWRPEASPTGAGGTAAATAVVLGGGSDRLVLVVQTSSGPRAFLGR